MRIPCPCCGERDLAEFAYNGDATVSAPAIDSTDSEAWQAFVFERKNPCGEHQELWQHIHGCRHILKVTRNTLTHKVTAAEVVGPWASALPSVKGLNVE